MTHSQLSNELQLLLLSSRHKFSSDDKTTCIEFARKGIDWEFFFYLARWHNVFPRVWENICSTHPQIFLDKEIENRLKAFNRKTHLECMAAVGQLVRISAIFNKEGIVHTPFKGPLLATYLYANFAMRHYGDLDILISASDLPHVHKLLVDQGYQPEVHIPPGQLLTYAGVEDSLTFSPGDGIPIEIHWELSGRFLQKPVTLDTVYPAQAAINLHGKSFPIFSPEVYLIYFCLHGTKHDWDQLDLIASIAELLEKERGLQWDKAISFADKFRCRTMFLTGLALSVKLYNSHLPDEIWNLIENNKKASANSFQATAAIMERANDAEVATTPSQDKRFSTLRLTSRDSLFDTLRHFLRLVSIPTKAEWKLVSLADSLVFCYWLIRPIRVFSDGMKMLIKKYLPD